MKKYLDLLTNILENGEEREDRTNTGTISVFGRQIKFDLADGFPIVTTKKMFFRGFVEEMLWIVSGSTNSKVLEDKGINIWKNWATEDGRLGPIYGHQLTKWIDFDSELAELLDYDGGSINQIENIVEKIKSNPFSRRLLMTTWNVADLPLDDESISPQENVEYGLMSLAPCHGVVIQFYVSKCKLHCQMYQRSCDAFLGAPANFINYGILVHMIAQQCDLIPGELIITYGDLHIYKNHIEQVKLQLTRLPYDLPELVIFRKPDSIFDYKYEDFDLVNYKHYPAIKAEVAV